MSENNEPIEVSFESLDSAVTRVKELEAKLATVKAECNHYESRMQTAENTLNRAKVWFEEMLAGDIDAETTVSEFQELMDILEVDATREVKIEVEVTWRGTIELPYGIEASDLDIDEFDIDFNGHNEYETNFTYDAIADSSIRERRHW